MTRSTIELTAMKRDLKYVNRANCCRNCTHYVRTQNTGVANCNLMRWPTQPEAICKKHERKETP
jgi:hypothetical protein